MDLRQRATTQDRLMNYDVSFVSSDAAHSPLCDPTIRFYTIPLSNEAIVNNTAHAKANVTQLNATYDISK